MSRFLQAGPGAGSGVCSAVSSPLSNAFLPDALPYMLLSRAHAGQPRYKANELVDHFTETGRFSIAFYRGPVVLHIILQGSTAFYRVPQHFTGFDTEIPQISFDIGSV